MLQKCAPINVTLDHCSDTRYILNKCMSPAVMSLALALPTGQIVHYDGGFVGGLDALEPKVQAAVGARGPARHCEPEKQLQRQLYTADARSQPPETWTC